MGDVIVISVLALVVGLVIFSLFKQKQKGGCSGCSGCSGSCNGCTHCPGKDKGPLV